MLNHTFPNNNLPSKKAEKQKENKKTKKKKKKKKKINPLLTNFIPSVYAGLRRFCAKKLPSPGR